MDPALLTTKAFWVDPAPLAFGAVTLPAGLEGHVLFATSGSSGIPKWVALSKKALLISAAAVNRHLQVTPHSCWGLALPIHHVGGFGVAARAHEAGCRFEHFGQSWDPEKFCNWVAGCEVTHTSLVPTQVHDLVQRNLQAPQSLRAIVVGGGRLETHLGQRARDLGWPVLASYGMTEAASQIATQGLEVLESPYKPDPIPLLPIWKAKCGDNDILLISGPALFSGYVIDGLFHPREGEWHATTDRVRLGGLSITPLGRADSLVKILGELVDPEAIEREIMAAANGLIAGSFAIVAVPDDRAGYLLQPIFEAQGPLACALPALAAYSANSPGYRRLQAPVIIGNFPCSELGKVRREELTRIFSDKFVREVS